MRKVTARKWHLTVPVSVLALLTQSFPTLSFAQSEPGRSTRSPIKHVIVLIGENRSFDHVFATYVPRPGQTVSNLLSKGIVNSDGTPGPNFAKAEQFTASDTDHYRLSPGGKSPYGILPAVNTDGTPTAPSDSDPAPFETLAAATAAEPSLLPSDLNLLLTGASGLPKHSIDTRIANVNHLPNGPYQLTPSLKYDDYAGSPVHRFYQMWQQTDCSLANATRDNPSGCMNDLYPWVETTIGAGSNGAPQPQPFTDQTTGEGSIAMGFYNVQHGDAPYLTQLAREFSMSDNFHQAVMGGTGANHVALGSGDAIWYSDGNGRPAVPPSNEIENPDAQPGSNNWYTQDGYSGGTYSNCSDLSQPGVAAVRSYLSSLSYHPWHRCEAGHYYLLNNYSPGYFGDGSVNHGQFVIPPSNLRTIGDELLERGIGWRYYGGHWNEYLQDPNFNNPDDRYCDICNPFQYETRIMTNPALRREHLRDVTDLYTDIANGSLPAVSFAKPDGFVDGHPASSKLDLYEGFVRKIVQAVQSNPALWRSTAIFVTFDEAGGYWDSGYVQPLDFFGDGPRIPMIVVSPYTRGGKVDHTYTDHVSILKFIEHNWGLRPVTSRSRDNLPNPISTRKSPYVPLNQPAIGDLFSFFDLGERN